MDVDLRIRAFSATDADAVVGLWRRCGLVRSHNGPYRDIARKLSVRPDLFLVGEHDGAIVAVVMAGYEGHRGWINYLGVDPRFQRRGWGRRIMDEAERRLRAEGCAKINLQVRDTNPEVIAFYRAIGYAVDPVVSLGKRLEHDE